MEVKDEAEKVDELFNTIKNYYMIYYGDPPVYSVKSAEFFIIEEQIYHLQKRIDDLDKMISSLLEKLNSMDFQDKNNMIAQVQKEKDLVKSYQIGYKKMFDFYCNNFSYYRKVFEFYKSKYYSGNYNKKKILDICVTIQESIRDNFFASYNQYSLLRKHYKESNEFILKIKGKF
jgi:hypothetical protein